MTSPAQVAAGRAIALTSDYATDLASGLLSSRATPGGSIPIGGTSPWIDLSASSVTAGGRAYGLNADMSGATDGSVAANNAVAALGVVRADGQSGGMILIPQGSLGLANTWNINQPLVRVAGIGSGSIIVPLTGGSLVNGLINVSANQCTLENFMFRGSSATFSNNPAADGIVFSGGNVTLRMLAVQAFYLNGWFFNFLSTATGYDVRMVACNTRQCAKGVTADGTSASGLSPSVTIMDCFMDTVGSAAAGGDCYYFQAAHDIILHGVFGSNAAGSAGAGVHWKGLCAAGQVTGSDFFGGNATSGWGWFEENNGANNPKELTCNTTIFSNYDRAVAHTAGVGVAFNGCTFHGNRNGSLYVAGGVANDSISMHGCISKENNTQNTAPGEFDIQNATPTIRVQGHVLLAGTNAIVAYNMVAGAKLRLMNCSNQPIGQLASPGVPATTVALTNPYPYDAMVYVLPGASTCAVAVAGVATGVTLASGGVAQGFRVCATQTITLTYAAGPTWTWFGD